MKYLQLRIHYHTFVDLIRCLPPTFTEIEILHTLYNQCGRTYCSTKQALRLIKCNLQDIFTDDNNIIIALCGVESFAQITLVRSNLEGLYLFCMHTLYSYTWHYTKLAI